MSDYTALLTHHKAGRHPVTLSLEASDDRSAMLFAFAECIKRDYRSARVINAIGEEIGFISYQGE